MVLHSVEHPFRLQSPEQAERFLLALGAKRVVVRGLASEDTAVLHALLEAADPGAEHTLNFEGGALEPLALDALQELVPAKYKYFDLRAEGADLRSWPGLRLWVHGTRKEPFEALLGRSLGPGAHALPEGQVTYYPHGTAYPLQLETHSVPFALRAFRALVGRELHRGFVNELALASRAPFGAWLGRTGARFSAVLPLEVRAARALTERCAGAPCEWQAGSLSVRLPSGVIEGFFSGAEAARQAAKWTSRVDEALLRARLR